MSRRSRKRKTAETAPALSVAMRLAAWPGRPWLLRGLAVGVTVACIVLAAVALDRHADAVLMARRLPAERVAFPGLPPVIEQLAGRELMTSLHPLLAEPWLADDLCQRIADVVGRSGWVRKLHHVRRNVDGTFEVTCDYRTPVAMVHKDSSYYLVDAEHVRLPGVYAYHESWITIEGVMLSAPPAGLPWPGEDLRAGIGLVRSLAGEPFLPQVTAILVRNYDGREDAHRSHIELATDRAGGRVRWGSAPGRELEENSLSAKTAILRANYASTGRLDAGYPVIDVSTFPDRFTVPG